ncbi:hypothetical protein RhiirA4_425711 [Rhizophagus irregularis]|uniref:Uncharacterized protein n=1 Tax=Rhizophagus irregularis TaxID=588596 RepID=A0A2I1H2A8_9GLOM|nr:hypothetical protein RhiirA4_425711 [Rhizophagus irregularis]
MTLHVLPHINLSQEDVSESAKIPTPPRIVIVEDHPDEVNDHTPLFTLEASLSSEEEKADSGNESGYASTIGNMQYMQKQMFTIIQDVQKKINEMYDTISQAIYTTTERSKYPSDERLMQVCYNALLNENDEEFQNKIKNIG